MVARCIGRFGGRIYELTHHREVLLPLLREAAVGALTATPSRPDDAGDMAFANAFKQEFSVPTIYTISESGIGKYEAGERRGTQEETSLTFPNAAKDGCGCKQAPRPKRKKRKK